MKPGPAPICEADILNVGKTLKSKLDFAGIHYHLTMGI